MADNIKILRDSTIALTAAGILLSGVLYVTGIRGDLDAFIATDNEHQKGCQTERENMIRDIAKLESQVENLYYLIYNQKKSVGGLKTEL